MNCKKQQIRGSIVVSISACHAEGPGSIPGRGVSKDCEDRTQGALQWVQVKLVSRYLCQGISPHGKVVSISARHAENPGSIPGRGVSRECEDRTKRCTAVGLSEVAFPMSLARSLFHGRNLPLSGCRRSSTGRTCLFQKNMSVVV